MIVYVCLFIGVILLIIAFACQWGDCSRYAFDQIRTIINNALHGVSNPLSARPSPPPSSIPAILKYSALQRVQNERDGEESERDEQKERDGEQKKHDNEQT